MRSIPLAVILALALPLHAQSSRPFTVVLDPAHGGADPGAQLSPDHPEKDFTLALARGLAAELRKDGVTVIALRDADTSLSADQRAIDTNTRHPDLYIALHGVPGVAPLRIFTAPLAPTHRRNAFLPWNSAQSAWIDQSKIFTAAIIAAASAQNQGVELHTARIPTLPSITAPAVAIEVSDQDDQTKITKIIADAVLKERGTQ